MAVAAAEVAVGLAIIVAIFRLRRRHQRRRPGVDALVRSGGVRRTGRQDSGDDEDPGPATLAPRAIAGGSARRLLDADAADPAVRGEGGRDVRPRQDRRLPAPLHRAGGRGGRRDVDAAARRLRDRRPTASTATASPRARDPRRIMAELFGRTRRRVSKGKGGSMHMFDKGVNFLGGHAIVGGHLPLAAGVGVRDQVPRAATRSSLCFFGDGAVPQGEFHESMNLAALWKLPVVFICENNRYAMGTAIQRALAQTEIWKFARSATAWPARRCDGMDVLRRARRAWRARWRGPGASRRPTLVEARTYRFRGHSMRDPAGAVYRTKDEVEEEKQRDPIVAVPRARSAAGGLLDEADVGRDREGRSTTRVDDAVAFAEASPEPPAESELRHRRAIKDVRRHGGDHVPGGAEPGPARGDGARRPGLPHRRGGRALRRRLQGDARGCSRSSASGASSTRRSRVGLHRRRASARRWSGCGPVVEMMTFNFALVALDQIVNSRRRCSTCRAASSTIPLVIRGPGGPAHQLAAQHSQSMESYFYHVPGLKVVRPSTPARRQGPAEARDPRRQPGDLHRGRDALRRQGRGAGGRRFPHPAREGRGHARGHATSRSSPRSGMMYRALEAAEELEPRTASRSRSSTRARCGRWTPRPSSGRCGRRTARVVRGGRRGLRRHGLRDRGRHHRAAPSTISTRRSSASPAPTRPCRTRGTSSG